MTYIVALDICMAYVTLDISIKMRLYQSVIMIH